MIFSRREMLSGGGAACMELLAAAPKDYKPRLTVQWAMEAVVALKAGGTQSYTVPFDVLVLPMNVDMVRVDPVADITFPAGSLGVDGSVSELWVLGPMGRIQVQYPPRGRNVYITPIKSAPKGRGLRIKGSNLTLAREHVRGRAEPTGTPPVQLLAEGAY